MAGTIRIGNQKGIGDFIKLRIVARSIFLLAILVQGTFALLFVLLHSVLPEMFVNTEDVLHIQDNAEVISIASSLMLIAAVFQISDGVQVVVLGALRGIQDVKIPMYITFVAYWVVGFPISIYLGNKERMGATGVWIGLCAGLTFAALFLYLRFNKLSKKLIIHNS